MKKRTISNKRRAIIYRDAGGECCYCGARIPQCNATIEHVIPLSSGGDNRPSNLRLCCRPCNLALGEMLCNRKLHINNIQLKGMEENQMRREIRRQFNTNFNALQRRGNLD